MSDIGLFIMAKKQITEIEMHMFESGLGIAIPVHLLSAFCDVIRHGMAFNRDQPEELHAFADKLSVLNHSGASCTGRSVPDNPPAL